MILPTRLWRRFQLARITNQIIRRFFRQLIGFDVEERVGSTGLASHRYEQLTGLHHPDPRLTTFLQARSSPRKAVPKHRLCALRIRVSGLPWCRGVHNLFHSMWLYPCVRNATYIYGRTCDKWSGHVNSDRHNNGKIEKFLMTVKSWFSWRWGRVKGTSKDDDISIFSSYRHIPKQKRKKWLWYSEAARLANKIRLDEKRLWLDE